MTLILNFTPVAGATIVWSGAWLVGTGYVTGAVVSYNGSAYIAVASSTGVIPGTDNSKWQLMTQGSVDSTAPAHEFATGSISGALQYSALVASDIPDISATYLKITGGTLTGTLNGPIINATTGFRFGGAATAGHVLRGNGTNFVDFALAAEDLSNGVSGTGVVILAGGPAVFTANPTFASQTGTGAVVLAGGNPTFTSGITITGDLLFTSDNGYDIGESVSTDVVLFSSDFPTSGDWPLPASWNDQSSGAITWASPNHVVFGVLPATLSDGYSVFQTPLGSAGGAVSFVVHGPSTGGMGLYLDTSITGTNADGYWLFLDQVEHVFQKFHNLSVVATYQNNSVPYSIPAGDHVYELSWRPVGTSAIVSYSIDGVVQVAAMDPSPPSSPLYPIFEPYFSPPYYTTGPIDIGSLEVISYVPTRPRTGYFGTSVVAPDGYFGSIGIAGGFQVAGAAASDKVLMGDGSNFVPSSVTRSISYVIDGGGAVPAAGYYGQLNVPVACTVTGWVLTGDVAGDCVVDVLKSTYANFPTTASIASGGAGDKPTIGATNQKAENLTVSGAVWTTALAAGDQLQFQLISCTTITRINITLIVSIP